MKVQRLNQRGFSHHLLIPLLVFVIVGGIGAHLVLKSRAAVCTSYQYSRGSSGTCVKYIQTLANWQGRLALAVDGSFGPGTETGVKTVQTKGGLKVDGVVGPQTWGYLCSQNTSSAIHSTAAFPLSTAQAAGCTAEQIAKVWGTTTTTTTTTTTAPSGSAASIAQAILASGKVTFNGYPLSEQAMRSAANGQRSVVEATRCGNTGGVTSVYLNAGMLQEILTLSQRYKINVSSTSNGCHSSTSMHYKGRAFDVNYINDVHYGWNTISRDAAAYAVNNFLAGTVVRQRQCVPSPVSGTASVSYVSNDVCSHQHAEYQR